MISNFKQVMEIARKKKGMRLCICAAQELEAILAAHRAKLEGLTEPILIGDKQKIIEIGKDENIDVEQYEIIHCPDPKEAAYKGVEMVSQGKGDIVMKGLVNTSIFMKAVLDKKVGLRTGRRLSHCGVFQCKRYHKFLFITDTAINITPDIKTKIAIIKNAIELTHAFEIETPRIGILSASERVSTDLPSTIEASILSRMGLSKQISGAIIDGPVSLDVALSKESAKRKDIESPVSGETDILLLPEIDSGNCFVKTLMFYSDAPFAGIVLGTRAPVIVTSRSDPTEDSKLYSIAVAMIFADYLKQKEVCS